MRPLVFVAMPFGRKRDERAGYVVDFDAIYNDGIRPALEGLPVDVIRADEERSGGVIHVAMFERLLLAEIAIVDVTIDNANVFYELGVRHTARASSTIIVASADRILPFDIAMIRAVPYKLDKGILTEANAAAFAHALRQRVTGMLSERTTTDPDSPLFTLIRGYPGVPFTFGTADSFRDRTLHLNDVRDRLVRIRSTLKGEEATAAIQEIERAELDAINDANFELVVDVLLSYRDVRAFDALLALVSRLPKPYYDRSVRIRQLQAFALNRRNQGEDRAAAIGLLQAAIAQAGDDPETCGILGSIFKLRYDAAQEAGDAFKAKAALAEATKWYRRGFLADPRDYYPGVNLCNLLAIDGSEKASAELRETLPAVRLAVKRSGGLESNDFWVPATVLSLALLAGDWEEVAAAHSRIVTLAEGGPGEKPQPWMLETTRNDLLKLRDAGIAAIDRAALQSLIDAVGRTLQELEGSPGDAAAPAAR